MGRRGRRPLVLSPQILRVMRCYNIPAVAHDDNDHPSENPPAKQDGLDGIAYHLRFHASVQSARQLDRDGPEIRELLSLGRRHSFVSARVFSLLIPERSRLRVTSFHLLRKTV